MSFSNMLEILKEKNKGKIVIIKLGAFYVATGEDAVLLHKKLNLNLYMVTIKMFLLLFSI